ncbi:glycosyltransferase involved in cell wall biosynthesis [Flavobacterium aquaticum]|uniref:Glycosyltransferase involved in cell wall biosynthesis n=1 Tax=Flavobacterium aquaticum TaxID=1236486 RepID=A0A327YNM3_9FLAO|nr:glycosyltransferase [Flavobacterium aquaticum]RAK22500.1 glycosyltransferase involved in cell wall biosynthesis [Flavobacterium aquaticum]
MTNHSKKQLKVAVIGYKLAEGGLERVFGTTTKMLHDEGIEVHTIVLEDKIEFEFAGQLVSFGKYSKFIKYFKLKNYLKKEKFDYVIDFRHRINPKMEWVFLHFIYQNVKTIYTIHSSKLENYLTENKWIAKLILQKAYKVVAVSNGVKQKIEIEFKNSAIEVIPNSFDFKTPSNSEILPFKYVIAVGRLVKLKQFDKLIESYSKSHLPEKNIHLVILGTGEEQANLEKKICDFNLQTVVHLLGFKENVYDYISKAKFLVLSSQYEGFSMVILEALSLGVPVISFDCEYGPRELIHNNSNGILVENQNFDELTRKLDIFVEDEILYQDCKNNAVSSVAKFHSSVIVNQWLQILKNEN